MVDIYLRSVPSDSNSGDVRLYDPTAVDVIGGTISGTFARTLDAFTQSATGQLLIKGTASATLGTFTQVATGNVLVKGTLSQTLGAFTQSGTGALTIKGQASQTLGSFAQTSTGLLLIQGQFGVTLGAFTQTAAGSAPSSGVSGTAFQTLDAFTQVATGSVDVPVLLHSRKRRARRKSRPLELAGFFETIETVPLEDVSAPVAAQARAAENAARQYLEVRIDDAIAKALLERAKAEIEEFYALLRADEKRRRDEMDEEDEEDLILLMH